MARDAVTLTALTINGDVAESAGTAVNVSNGASVDVAGDTQGVVIVLKNTNGSDRVATIVAGTNPPAMLEGIGDLAVTVPATSGVKMVCLEGGRFVQSDGKIYINYAASFAGTAHAYRLPRGVR